MWLLLSLFGPWPMMVTKSIWPVWQSQERFRKIRTSGEVRHCQTVSYVKITISLTRIIHSTTFERTQFSYFLRHPDLKRLKHKITDWLAQPVFVVFGSCGGGSLHISELCFDLGPVCFSCPLPLTHTLRPSLAFFRIKTPSLCEGERLRERVRLWFRLGMRNWRDR